jgi:hypothetical protein
MIAERFLFAVMILGAVFPGFTGIMAWQRKNRLWDEAEKATLRLSLTFGFFAVVFALLPFALYFVGGTMAFTWRLSSLIMVIYLFGAIWQGMALARRFKTQWPVASISLLVISTIFLTMELINAIWWSSLGAYALGLLWLLTLAGVQFIVFTAYDQQPMESRGAVSVAAYTHSDPLRLWRQRSAGYSNGAGYGHAHLNPYSDPHARLGRNPNRYTDSGLRRANGRAIAYTPVRSDTHAVGRTGGPYRRR